MRSFDIEQFVSFGSFQWYTATEFVSPIPIVLQIQLRTGSNPGLGGGGGGGGLGSGGGGLRSVDHSPDPIRPSTNSAFEKYVPSTADINTKMNAAVSPAPVAAAAAVGVVSPFNSAAAAAGGGAGGGHHVNFAGNRTPSATVGPGGETRFPAKLI